MINWHIFQTFVHINSSHCGSHRNITLRSPFEKPFWLRGVKLAELFQFRIFRISLSLRASTGSFQSLAEHCGQTGAARDFTKGSLWFRTARRVIWQHFQIRITVWGPAQTFPPPFSSTGVRGCGRSILLSLAPLPPTPIIFHWSYSLLNCLNSQLPQGIFFLQDQLKHYWCKINF